MIEYITLSATAWFMGFFPLLEIYIAIPATMLMGLDPVSAVVWASLGNFLPIPLLVFFYDQLAKIKRVNAWLHKLSQTRYRSKVEQYGGYVILIMTPIVGSWALGVIGRGLGMQKSTLFISSGLSILLYGIILAVLTHMGVEVFV